MMRGRASGQTLLLVTGDPSLGDRLAAILQQAGHHVVAVLASAEEAVLEAWGSTADLALIDVRLATSESGFQAIRVITDQLGLPVVYISASALSGLEAASTRPDELIAMLGRLAGRTSTH